MWWSCVFGKCCKAGSIARMQRVLALQALLGLMLLRIMWGLKPFEGREAPDSSGAARFDVQAFPTISGEAMEQQHIRTCKLFGVRSASPTNFGMELRR